MACFHPREAWFVGIHAKTGKRRLGFRRPTGVDSRDADLVVPCRKCIGCRIDNSRDWAVRAMHEAHMHQHNCVVHLTYRDECLPKFGSLSLEDHQNFLKRLRKSVEPSRIKFMLAGEYGDKDMRPHYHACLFGVDFPDRYYWKLSRSGEKLYRSPQLEKLWPNGFATISNLCFQSAAYVGRYVLKKRGGEQAEERYGLVDHDTGEIIGKARPEYVVASNGLGRSFFLKYGHTMWPDDFVVVEGRKMPIPNYYLRLLEKLDPELFALVKEKREEYSKGQEWDRTPERLAVRKEVFLSRVKRLNRS